MEDFEDLTIVDFDDSQVQSSRLAPSFKRMALVLSSAPPPGWGPMLQSKYHLRYVDKRIEVSGRNVWVECQPENLQTVLDELKPLVAETNAEIKESIARLKREQEDRDQGAMAEKQRLANIKKNLKF